MGQSSSLDDPIWRLIKASIRTRNQICDFKMWCLHDLTLRAKPSCAEPSPASSSCLRSPGSSACSSGVEGPRPWEGRLSGLSCRRTQCIQRRPRANPYLQRKRNASKPSPFLTLLRKRFSDPWCSPPPGCPCGLDGHTAVLRPSDWPKRQALLGFPHPAEGSQVAWPTPNLRLRLSLVLAGLQILVFREGVLMLVIPWKQCIMDS